MTLLEKIITSIKTNEELLTNFPQFVIDLCSGQLVIVRVNTNSRYPFTIFQNGKELHTGLMHIYFDLTMGWTIRMYQQNSGSPFHYVKLYVEEIT